jgi:hypothetical protein
LPLRIIELHPNAIAIIVRLLLPAVAPLDLGWERVFRWMERWYCGLPRPGLSMIWRADVARIRRRASGRMKALRLFCYLDHRHSPASSLSYSPRRR